MEPRRASISLQRSTLQVGKIAANVDLAALTAAQIGAGARVSSCNIDTAPDVNDYVPNAAAGQAGYQTMKWSTVDNVTVSAGNTTTVSLQ